MPMGRGGDSTGRQRIPIIPLSSEILSALASWVRDGLMEGERDVEMYTHTQLDQLCSRRAGLACTVWRSGREDCERRSRSNWKRKRMERERGKREEIEKSASSVTLSAERNCIPESERGPLPPPPYRRRWNKGEGRGDQMCSASQKVGDLKGLL